MGVVHVFDGRGAGWSAAAGLASVLCAGDVVVSSGDAVSRVALGRVGVLVDAWVSCAAGSARGLGLAVESAVGGGCDVVVWGSASRLGRLAWWEGRVVLGGDEGAAAHEASLWRGRRAETRACLGIGPDEFAVGFGGHGPVDAGRASRGLGVLRISGRACVGVVHEDEAAGASVRGSLRCVQFAEDHEHPWRVLMVGGSLGMVYSALDLLVWFDADPRVGVGAGGRPPLAWSVARGLGVGVLADSAFSSATIGVDAVSYGRLWPAVALAAGIERAAERCGAEALSE